jgi:hypothetical protein
MKKGTKPTKDGYRRAIRICKKYQNKKATIETKEKIIERNRD